MNSRFEEIYATNEWGQGSGEGSFPLHTKGYVSFLHKFLSRLRVESVVDMGCGDWQFSRGVRWGRTRYDGYDVVPAVIARNQQAHASERVRFHLYSGDPGELPPADLLIAKDVLQHLSNDDIFRFLPHLSRYKFALLTNCVNPTGPTVNRDILTGEFRRLDLRLPPFELPATQVFSFKKKISLVAEPKIWWQSVTGSPEWRKVVLLVDNRKT